jgi:hypothetical protein
MPTTRRPPTPARRDDVDPAVRPFLDEIAAIIAARLIEEHRRRTAEKAASRGEAA